MTAALHITTNAASKVWELIQESEDLELKLRISVTGGGCSGLRYDFTFDKTVLEDDYVIVKDNVQFLVDSISYQYLKSAEVDYKEDIEGSQFIIRNPNAKTTCGCGSSFSA